MNAVQPTLSVIIPVKNGMPHLEHCVTSVLRSESAALEVLISVDDSKDGSLSYALSIRDPRVKVVVPRPGLSMSEHWDFAQSCASGSWQLFLGQDDLLAVDYFSEVIKLIEEATRLSIGAVVARRAYVYWAPLNSRRVPALQYWGTSIRHAVDSVEFVKRALLTDISYHEGPQGYTSSLISLEILERVRAKNNGRLIVGHPQDAFLAAEVLDQADTFLYSDKPFSFVGTSSNSAGLAVSRLKGPLRSEASDVSLANAYLNSIEKSAVGGSEVAKSFRHGSNVTYFKDALHSVGWSKSPLPREWPLARRVRHDIAVLSSGAAKRIDKESLDRILSSGLSASLLNTLASALAGWQTLTMWGLHMGAKCFKGVARNRLGLIRLEGPQEDFRIMAIWASISVNDTQSSSRV